MSKTDPEDLTPPRGGAKRNTKYSMVDDRGLLERAADNANQARHEVREQRVELAAFREEVRMVLRPYVRPWYERGGTAAIAAVLFAWFVLYTVRTSSSTVPEPVPHTTASR